MAMEAQTSKTSAYWWSSRGQHLDDKPSQGSVRSVMEWSTFMTTRLLHDSVCHPGYLEGVRPWPSLLAAARSPDGADDRPPIEEQARKNGYTH